MAIKVSYIFAKIFLDQSGSYLLWLGDFSKISLTWMMNTVTERQKGKKIEKKNGIEA